MSPLGFRPGLSLMRIDLDSLDLCIGEVDADNAPGCAFRAATGTTRRREMGPVGARGR